MRKVFYQWAGVGILSLIGWGVSVVPSNTSWIPSIALWAIAGLWFAGTLVSWWKNRGKKPAETVKETVIKSENLIETLTAMHRRLVELQKEKASHTRIGLRQLEKVFPTLADRLGIIKLKDWPKYAKSIKRRIQRAIPRPNFSRPLSFVKIKERQYQVSLSVALAIKRELLQSREWTFEDGLKISEWLDGYHWGVKELRDNDPQWNMLFKSIGHYLLDAKLRELIDRHIDFSYICNNLSLITHYSENFPKTSFLLMLHETLVGSSISPEKVEIALSEILEEITRRIKPAQLPENWIDAYKNRHGNYPYLPDYLHPVVTSYSPGEPISKNIKVKIASGQLWNRLLPSQRDELLELVEWLGQDRRDYLAQMRRMLPKKSPKGPGRWTPFKQG